ncbi:MAG: dihydrolipoyl dehydrogenase [Candidatus Aenigmatarchaeota archaeon]
MKNFDLIVVGSGSGLDVASGASRSGLKVAVVEKDRLGGTCLNRGCIPSKMLIHRADIIETIQDSEKFGIDSEIKNIDFSSIIKEINEEVKMDSESIENGLKKSDYHTLYKGEAKFVGNRTLEINGKRISGDKIIIAAGSRPKIPPINGIEEVDYITSKEALKLEELPEHMIIVGGGYIAAELGHFYGSMGTEVTIIGRNELMIPNEDKDISQKFTEIFKEKYNVQTGFEVEKVCQKNGEIFVKAVNEKGEEIETSGDELLIATGRKPNSDLLEVEKANIETDKGGFIKTNEYLETSVENIWALGDIAGNWMFKHSANLEAQYIFINAIRDHKHKIDYTAMPHAIFSSPQVAGVGKTEEELESEDREYLKGIYEYEDTGMGMALKEGDGFVKVLVDPENGKILGCHIVGPDASQLIHEVLVSMRAGSGTVQDIRNTVHIHPALNEVVQRAFGSLKR